MEYLFDRWEVVDEALTEGVLLFFDYDGTLTPIVERPELAILPPSTKELLKRVSDFHKLAIISGRSLAEIKKLVGLDGIYYAGNHGFEISGPGIELIKPEAERTRSTLAEICKKLRRKLGHIEGAMVEDKGLTASVHYRLVARVKFKSVKKIFAKTVKPYVDSGVIKITQGKKVFEIRPNVKWDKGKAVLWIIKILDPRKNLIPVYMGDDRTDEDGFIALEEGITILVSEKRKKSNAKFFLRNLNEVQMFLKKICSCEKLW